MSGKFVFLNKQVFIKTIYAQQGSNNAPHLTNPFCHELIILKILVVLNIILQHFSICISF